MMKGLLRSKKGANDLAHGMAVAIAFFGGIVTLVVLGFVLIILAGNLEGASGLTAGTIAANASTAMLQNVTLGAAGFFSNATTWFSLLSIVIIIATVIIVLTMVRKKGGIGE